MAEYRLQSDGVENISLCEGHQQPAVVQLDDAGIVHTVIAVIAQRAPGLSIVG